MFSAQKDGKAPAEEVPIHRIRITLTSRNVKSLEKGNEQKCLTIVCSFVLKIMRTYVSFFVNL